MGLCCIKILESILFIQVRYVQKISSGIYTYFIKMVDTIWEVNNVYTKTI